MLAANGTIDPVWQMRIADSVEAGMTPPELTQWQTNGLSAVVPAATVEGSKLFANFLGYIFSVNLTTGKLLWRSASFHHVKLFAMQNQGPPIDASRFAIAASGDFLWSLGRDLRDQNFMAPFGLTCRRSNDGEMVWHSNDLPDYAQLDMVGPPLLVAGKLFIVAKGGMNPQNQQGLPQQYVLAIQPHDGKLLWKTEVGTFRQGQQQYMYYGMRDASPRRKLLYRAGAVYVDTHVGVLARLDADSGSLDWGYGYQTEAAQGGGRFFFFMGYSQQEESTTTSSPPLPKDEALLIKGAQSGHLCAIDPNRMKMLWDRPIAKSSRLLGADDQCVYLGGPELSAMDLKTRQLSWVTRLPNGKRRSTRAGSARRSLAADSAWCLRDRPEVGRGPPDFSRRSTSERREGDLFLTDQLLMSVSNRAISAYPRTTPSTLTMTRASNDSRTKLDL